MNTRKNMLAKPRFYSPGWVAMASVALGAGMWLGAFWLNARRNQDSGNVTLLWHMIIYMFAIAWAAGIIGFYAARRSSRVGDRVFAIVMLVQGALLVLLGVAELAH